MAFLCAANFLTYTYVTLCSHRPRVPTCPGHHFGRWFFVLSLALKFANMSSGNWQSADGQFWRISHFRPTIGATLSSSKLAIQGMATAAVHSRNCAVSIK